MKALTMKKSETTPAKAETAARFSLGRVVATPGALELMTRTNTDAFALLVRHATGDWGDCDPEDAQTNEEALANGLRVMSVYRLPGVKGEREMSAKELADELADNTVWIITEADRSVTTFLTPIEY